MYIGKGVIGIKEAKNLLLIAIVLVAISFLSACQPQPSSEAGNDSTELVNPSATYCVEQGNSYIIKTAEDGSQSGICILEDGTACDGWAYFRKECGVDDDTTAPDRQEGGATGAGAAATDCTADSNCVPAECCHPTTCINSESKGVCNLMCTMECRPGTLDCGQGSCKCIAGNCEAVMG